MSGGITYCTGFPEDENFGSVINSFLFRRTGSCITNPEYEPGGMLNAVLHALASFECTKNPFLAVVILPVWDDTPCNSSAVRGQGYMSTLIHIPAGHMRFVLPHKQSDGATSKLSPAEWPVKLDLIANEKGRDAFLNIDRIQKILAPATQDTCCLTPAETLFFLTPPSTGLAP